MKQVILLLPVLLILSCTSNPAGGDSISQGRRSMSGKVILNENSSSNSSLENIFVWMEEFDISTRTDAAGEFSLTLPPPGSQNNSGGVSGVFQIYFYLANYSLETAEVLIRDGEFMYGRADLDNSGSLVLDATLDKFLHVKTEIAPASVPRSYDNIIGATVELSSTTPDSVSVVFPNSIGGSLGAIFMRNTETGQIYVLSGPPDGARDKVVITQTGTSRPFVFDLAGPTAGNLPVGRYEVIPYILVVHEPVPRQLIESLGNEVEELTPNYLKIPFRRELATFEIE